VFGGREWPHFDRYKTEILKKKGGLVFFSFGEVTLVLSRKTARIVGGKGLIRIGGKNVSSEDQDFGKRKKKSRMKIS